MNRTWTILTGVLGAILAPMLLLGVIGLGYVVYVFLSDSISWSAAIEQGMQLLFAYQDYLSLLTVFPIVLGVTGIYKAIRQQR